MGNPTLFEELYKNLPEETRKKYTKEELEMAFRKSIDKGISFDVILKMIDNNKIDHSGTVVPPIDIKY
jgi:hypothetical protein